MKTLTDSLREKFGLGFISFTQLYNLVCEDLGATLNPQEVRNVFIKEVVREEGIYYDMNFGTYKKN